MPRGSCRQVPELAFLTHTGVDRGYREPSGFQLGVVLPTGDIWPYLEARFAADHHATRRKPPNKGHLAHDVRSARARCPVVASSWPPRRPSRCGRGQRGVSGRQCCRSHSDGRVVRGGVLQRAPGKSPGKGPMDGSEIHTRPPVKELQEAGDSE